MLKKKDNKKRILVVEDEKMLVDMYRDKFEHEGFEVLVAEEGEEGLKKAFEEKPDLIILDILLPKKEGTEILKEIRESDEWGNEVPVVMLTNMNTSDYILGAVNQYRPSYYFIKSNIELNELVAKVRKLID